MMPHRPETFETVVGGECLDAGTHLSKVSTHPEGPLGEYFGFGTNYRTSEQAQGALDLLGRLNSAEYLRELVAITPVCGCYGPIAESANREWQFETDSSQALRQTDVRRLPHDPEVRASRALLGVLAGGLIGGFIGAAA
jgi:hypothetical protein